MGMCRLAALVVLLLVGWPTGGRSEPVHRFVTTGRPTSLLPFFADDAAAARLVDLIFDGLLTVDTHGAAVGGLAVAWRPDPDGSGIRFELRRGVTWHDGVTFTAEDVAFTIGAAQDRRTRWNGQRAFDVIGAVTLDGPFAVHVALLRPIVDPERLFRFAIIPKHAFRGTALSARDRFARAPIGTGPYRLVNGGFSLRHVTLEANPAYWIPVSVPGIEMVYGLDAAARAPVRTFSPRRAIRDAETGPMVVLEPDPVTPGAEFSLVFHHGHRALSEGPVREAMSLAIDRMAPLNDDPVPGGSRDADRPASPLCDHVLVATSVDLERAERLLDAAGWHRQGEIRARGRHRLDFEVVLDKTMWRNQVLFLDLQRMLSRIGVRVRPVFLEHAQYRDRVFLDRGFDLTIDARPLKRDRDITPTRARPGASCLYLGSVSDTGPR